MRNDSENRVGKKPVPDDVLEYMNTDQLLTYRGMQSFGWHLKFVRRPLFQRPVFVMSHPDSDTLAVLEENGKFNREHNIRIRGSALDRELQYAPA
jgi:hypothetical protein